MQTILKRFVAVMLTIMLIIGGLLYVQDITRVKTAVTRDMSYKTFFDYASEYDVLYFGTSHVMYGINPLEIWNDYGITSYNWGSPTCSIPSIYWKLMNILDYSTPKLVVIDCLRVTWTYKSYNTYRLHEAFDAFPLSYTKWKAVNDLMKDQARMEDGMIYSDLDRFNLLFPLSAYHSRWDQIGAADFNYQFVDTKGCEFEINVAEPREISNTTEKAELTEEMQGVIYLRKIIEECQNREISVLLTYLPYPTDEKGKKESNVIQQIADEYGVNYINFTDIDVVNYDTDYSDPTSHMNITGQKKVSEFLGNYIIENYDIEDKRNDINAAQWNSWYSTYKDYEKDFLKKQYNLSSYLMLLYKSNDVIVIDMKDSSILNNYVYFSLITNIGEGSNEINSETDFIIAQDGKVVVLDDFRDNGVSKDTEIGTVSLYYGEDVYGLYVNGDEYYIGTLDDAISMQIKVRKGDLTIDNVKFSYVVDANLDVNIFDINRD